MDQKAWLNRYLAVAERNGLKAKENVSKLLRGLLEEDNPYEGVPSSMLWFDRTRNAEDPKGKGRSKVGYTDDRPTDMYGAQKGQGRLSIFEGALAEFCLMMWSDPGDLVLDPFAGRLTRMIKTCEAGRSYLGYDTSHEAWSLNKEYAKEKKLAARVLNRALLDDYDPQQEPDVDFVFTCPPYWNSEFYGDNAHGLEGTPDYNSFLEELVATFAVAADRLKPDGYVVVVVKDFYFRRQMVSFHSDVIRGLTGLGLVQWDCIAKKIGTQREIFHRDIIQHRRTAQTHEYVLVFRKSKPSSSKDLYRKRTFERCTERRKVEEDRKLLRQQVLKAHGLEPSWLHPAVQKVSM